VANVPRLANREGEKRKINGFVVIIVRDIVVVVEEWGKF